MIVLLSFGHISIFYLPRHIFVISGQFSPLSANSTFYQGKMCRHFLYRFWAHFWSNFVDNFVYDSISPLLIFYSSPRRCGTTKPVDASSLCSAISTMSEWSNSTTNIRGFSPAPMIRLFAFGIGSPVHRFPFSPATIIM